MPYDKMDLCIYAHNAHLPVEAPAAAVGITPEQMERVYQMIESKRRATRYLHLGPQLVEEVSEVMKNPKIQIKVALGLGKGRDRVLTCDLTKEYVAINGDYRS